MNEFAEYIVKSGISLAILYFFYWLLLRKDTHFRLNRMVLLFSVLVSLLVPFINIYLFANQHIKSDIPVFYAMFDEIVIKASSAPVNTVHVINWWKVIAIIYSLGALAVFARLVYQGIYLHVMAKLSKTICKGNFTIVIMNAEITPFAYFNKVFIPASKANDHSIETILIHERAHQQQYHFVDLFLMQIITVIQWFNPIVWLYEQSLKEVHEYLADEAVLNRGQNKGVYQALLVNEAMGGQVFSLTNQFNQSLIKKRIVMMTKMKTSRLAQLKVLLVVPLLLLLLLAFANPKSVIKPIAQKGNELLNEASKPFGGVVTKSNSFNVPEDTAKSVSNLTGPQPPLPSAPPPPPPVEDAPFLVVDQMPEYPGGIDSMMRFLSQNIKYPQEALKNNITGRVILQFIVDKQGKVTDVKVLRGIGGGCNDEAIRVVNLMPAWKPGKNKGNMVSVYFTLPIVFSQKK